MERLSIVYSINYLAAYYIIYINVKYNYKKRHVSSKKSLKFQSHFTQNLMSNICLHCN